MNRDNKLPYIDFLGLNRNPFPVTPDADDFFVSTDTDTIITELVHGIEMRKGFFVLTGEVGVGKTTISRRILQVLTDEKINTSLVFHSLLPELGLIRQINKDFGITGDAGGPDEELSKLNDYVLEQNSCGNNCAIIIDDAQNLSWESLEVIRMISNLEGNSEKLVQILLVGQPELLERLNNDNLRQLKSRIVIQHAVTTLSRQGLQKYIDFKLTATGPTRLSIPNRVLNKIYAVTKGNLRRVNIMMDRCLYIAYSSQSQTLTPQMISNAATELRIKPSGFLPRPWLLATLLLAIILTTSVALTGISNSSRPITKKVSPAHIPIERPVETKPVPQKVPGSVVSFLSQYNLEGYARQFWKALQFNNLLPLQQEISRDRGLEMISLPQIPNGLNGLDALRVNGQTDGGSHYIYFWKPSLKIKQFHRDVRGQEIVQLQHLLAGEYYAGAIDGIVGPMLAQSITDFQTDMRLPISGVPDSQTLFLLYALKQKQERSK